MKQACVSLLQERPSAFDFQTFVLIFLGQFMPSPDEFDHLRFLRDAGESIEPTCSSYLWLFIRELPGRNV